MTGTISAVRACAMALLIATTAIASPERADARGWGAPLGLGLAGGLALGLAIGGEAARATPRPTARAGDVRDPMDHVLLTAGRITVAHNEAYPKSDRTTLASATLTMEAHNRADTAKLTFECLRGGLRNGPGTSHGWRLTLSHGHRADDWHTRNGRYEGSVRWPGRGTRWNVRGQRLDDGTTDAPRIRLIDATSRPYRTQRRSGFGSNAATWQLKVATDRTSETYETFHPTTAERAALRTYDKLCDAIKAQEAANAEIRQAMKATARRLAKPVGTPKGEAANRRTLTEALMAVRDAAEEHGNAARIVRMVEGFPKSGHATVDRNALAIGEEAIQALTYRAAATERALGEWLRPRLTRDLNVDGMVPNESRRGGALIRLSQQLAAEITGAERVQRYRNGGWWRRWWTQPDPDRLRLDDQVLTVARTGDGSVTDVRMSSSETNVGLTEALDALGW